MLSKQHRKHGDALHLGEFLPGTCAGPASPRYEGALGGLEPGRRGRVEPTPRAPGEDVRAPVAGVGMERLNVDGDEGVWGENVASFLEGNGLGVEACGLGDVDYGVVEAEGFEL